MLYFIYPHKLILIIMINLLLVTTSFGHEERALNLHYIPKINKSVTFVGLGALEIGRDWGIGLQGERNHVDEKTAQRLLKFCLKRGINVIDTASSYHKSEELIGKYLSFSHNKFLIITKSGEHSILANVPRCQQVSSDHYYCNKPAAEYDFSEEAIRRDITQSMKKLNTKKLDLVFIHFNDDAKRIIDKGEAVAALKQLQQEGKIRFIGASIDDVTQTTRCIKSGNFSAIEVEYNLLNQQQAKNIALAHKLGMGVFIRGGLGTGLLTSRSLPYLNDIHLPFRQPLIALLHLTHNNPKQLTALALAFIYSNKNIDCLIIGAKNKKELKEDIKLLNNFSNWDLLEKAKKIMQNYPTNKFTDSIDAYFS